MFLAIVFAVIVVFGALGAIGAYVLTLPAAGSAPPSAAVSAPPKPAVSAPPKPADSASPKPADSASPKAAGPRNCTPTALLVNPCRPWFGAAANGNPGAGSSRLAQFNYVEKLVGDRLDIFRDYHAPPGSGALGDLPLNSTEIALARRPNTYIDVNWKPAYNWAQADGSNPAVNRNIARAAARIKSIAPHKIFLTLWWEPQHYVTSDPANPRCRLSGDGTGGTPAQYIAMWQNVEKIFRANGVTNVVWAMDYQASHGMYDCLVPQLWPGNNLVDWVLYDTYSRTAQDTWANTVGPFYNLLLHDSSPRVNFDSKPWGLGEFGTCSNTDTVATQNFYLQGKAALAANKYPRLKMYVAFDDATGPAAGAGCLSNYTQTGRLDATKQADFNQFADAVLAGGK